PPLVQFSGRCSSSLSVWVHVFLTREDFIDFAPYFALFVNLQSMSILVLSVRVHLFLISTSDASSFA
ncbi:unnamed protein product, partial [Mycena citricolor]